MSKRKISKKSKRRLILFAPLSLVIIAFFFFNLITYTINIMTLTKQENDLEKKLVSLELEAKDLNTEILKLKDPEYIAKYAREKYYYSKDGEYVIKLEENKKEENEEKPSIKYGNYIIYIGIGILFIIFIFIAKKRKSK